MAAAETVSRWHDRGTWLREELVPRPGRTATATRIVVNAQPPGAAQEVDVDDQRFG